MQRSLIVLPALSRLLLYPVLRVCPAYARTKPMLPSRGFDIIVCMCWVVSLEGFGYIANT